MEGLILIDPVTGEFQLWIPHDDGRHGPGLLLSELVAKSDIEDCLDLIDARNRGGRACMIADPHVPQ